MVVQPKQSDTALFNFKHILGIIARIFSNVALIMVAVIALVVVADVILRNANHGVPGLPEIGAFLMVAVTFLTLPFVTLKKGNLNIPILLEKFSPRVQQALTLGNAILGLILLSFLIWRSSLAAIDSQHASLTSMMLQWPIYPFMWLIPLGLAVSGLILLTDFWDSLKSFFKTRWWPGLIIIILIPLIFCTVSVWFGWLGISKEISGLLSIVVMLALLFLGLPIAYSLMFAGLGTIGYLTSWGALLSTAGTAPYFSIYNYFLVCIPLFLLMGSLCVFSGISKDLFATAQAWLGRLPGSLALATIAGGAMFGAVCGDSIATAAAMGKVSLEPMKKAHYDPGFAGACVAVSGTLGILIPPSIPMVIYAVLTETSISDLFMAGIIPGILTAFAVMITIYFWVKRSPSLAPLGERTSTREKLVSLKGTIPMLVLFILVIGGMYAGWFSPIEGGAVGTFGALLYTIIRRTLTWKNLNESLLDAAQITGMVLLILVGITFLNSAMSLSQIPFRIAEFAAGLQVSKWVFFAGLIVLYLIAGMIMNVFAAIMITLPILLPLLVQMQFDLVWLGMIMILLIMIGQVTPPVAIVVFAVTAMNPDVPMGAIFKRVTLLWLTEAAVIVIIILIPQIATFLPQLMKGG